MKRFKVMRPCDIDMGKLSFPYWVFPKYDGVHGIVSGGYLTGRSGKKFANVALTTAFSIREFDGFNGEILHRDYITGDAACRMATSLVNTKDGEYEDARFYVFDVINEDTQFLPFRERLEYLNDKVRLLRAKYMCNHAHPIHQVTVVDDYQLASNIDDIDYLEELILSGGYEGIILRKPTHYYRPGKMTTRIGSVLRKKRFADSEILVTRILEGQRNENDLFTDPNGYAERSTDMEGMVPSGMVGTIIGKDVHTGQEVYVSPGKMTHGERMYYWNNPKEILGKFIKYKYFPKGIKDKPRQPTFQCFRAAEDM